MNYDDLIKFFGSQSGAARALGVKPPSVHAWREGGIPLTRQYQIQVLTGDALKADESAPPAEQAA